MIRRLGVAVLGALLVTGPVVAAWAASPELDVLGFEPYEPPKPAPEFSLPDLEGRTWNLASLKGKVVLLFFWATW